MRFSATELFIFVDAGFGNQVTIKCEIIFHNTSELLLIMSHTNIILKQVLWRTEIEGNYIQTNSTDIITVWKSWIDDLVSFTC